MSSQRDFFPGGRFFLRSGCPCIPRFLFDNRITVRARYFAGKHVVTNSSYGFPVPFIYHNSGLIIGVVVTARVVTSVLKVVIARVYEYVTHGKVQGFYQDHGEYVCTYTIRFVYNCIVTVQTYSKTR